MRHLILSVTLCACSPSIGGDLSVDPGNGPVPGGDPELDAGTTDSGDAAEISRTAPFALATTGCPMAHCDPQMSDRDPLVPPTAANQHWKDTSVSGSAIGLGCSSNGSIAACTTLGTGLTPSLIVYRPDGSHLWDSRLLDAAAIASAPIIDSQGGVIAVDDTKLLRYDATGSLIWRALVQGGVPISPVPVNDQFIFLATGSKANAAPLALYDATSGALLATASVLEPGDTAGAYYYATANTPTVSGTRVYVVMQRLLTNGSTDPNPVGRLMAFDVSTAGIVEAWRTDPFRAPSGASPLLIGNRIFFDGAAQQPSDPASKTSGYFFGVQDDTTTGDFVWETQIGGPSQASASEDPRGGFWVWAAEQPTLIHLDVDGNIMPDTIADLGTLIGRAAGTMSARSATSMTGPNGAPVIIISLAHDLQNNVCALALGATTSSPVTNPWCFDSGAVAAGQFPIIDDAAGDPVVVFSTGVDGVYGIGN